jgi:hypothetical protein
MPELVQHFQIPPHLLSSVYRRSNGFFTFEESLNEDGQLQVYCVLKHSLEQTATNVSARHMVSCASQGCLVRYLELHVA